MKEKSLNTVEKFGKYWNIEQRGEKSGKTFYAFYRYGNNSECDIPLWFIKIIWNPKYWITLQLSDFFSLFYYRENCLWQFEAASIDKPMLLTGYEEETHILKEKGAILLIWREIIGPIITQSTSLKSKPH